MASPNPSRAADLLGMLQKYFREEDDLLSDGAAQILS